MHTAAAAMSPAQAGRSPHPRFSPALRELLKPVDGRLLLKPRPAARPCMRRWTAVDGEAAGIPPPAPAAAAAAAPAPARADNLAVGSLLNAFAVPDVTMAKQLGLTESHLQSLMELPGTATVSDLKSRLVALAEWNSLLRRGVLPRASDVDWPAEPFRSKFLGVLKRLEMARFTRRHPKLLASLLRQFLQLVKEFEGDLAAAQEQQQQQQQSSKQQQPPQKPESGGDQDAKENCEQGEGSGGQAPPPPQASDEDQQNVEQQAGQASTGDGDKGEVQMQLESVEGGANDAAAQAGEDDASDGINSGYAERLAEEMLAKFEGDWAPAMEALDIAANAFEDVDGLMDGPEGFDSASSVWQRTGWREVDALRRRLEGLRELRDLVRSLGRGGGKGPLKRAPELVWAAGRPPGVVRSEQSPEETRGLTRSGDLSRMLPSEAHLLAAGWPRRGSRRRDETETTSEDEQGEGGVAVAAQEGGSTGGAAQQEGSRACRMLFMARRAERMLMSYERAGWVEDEPSRATGRMEVRPAAELGPIILCLDTSGSMRGARETVAKALALECMRGAHRQGRRCYLYAFSGPGDVAELELGTDAESLKRLLGFLSMGFEGGTDVDAPLALSLERVGREEWELADIMMVTDGEIPMPNEDILQRLRSAGEHLGLEVHGLLVGRNVTEPMQELCTHLHVFKSWSAFE